ISLEDLKGQISDICKEITSNLNFPNIDYISLGSELNEIDYNIDETRNSLFGAVDALDEKRDFIKEIGKELYSLKERYKYISLLIERFNVLKTHYITDLDRIEVISQASFFLENFTSDFCQVCTTPIGKKNDFSFDDYYISCSAEENKIKNQLKGLIESIIINEQEKLALSLKISDVNEIYQSEMADFKRLESESLNDLQHKLDELYEKKEILSSDYTKHKILLSLEEREEVIDDDKYDVNDFDTLSPREVEGIERLMEGILNDIGFEGISKNQVRFDNEKYDFFINNKHRNLFGKGSRSVIYACFTICLAEYLSNNGKPFLGFVLLDSPLVTHFDKVRGVDINEINNTSLSDKFYHIILSKKYRFQIIILENKGPTFTVINDDESIVHNLNYDDRTGFYPT
ncbi:hypothetical protein L7G72_17825, partial [Xenorhabdus bovienii]|uniref:hypothetical protein n=1 Tax=Xenorhabdus bovienii TaxID=40576 RepID=UPI001EDE7C5B